MKELIRLLEAFPGGWPVKAGVDGYAVEIGGAEEAGDGAEPPYVLIDVSWPPPASFFERPPRA